MPIPSAGFPGATSGSDPSLTPVGSTGNTPAIDWVHPRNLVAPSWSRSSMRRTVLSAISNTDYEGEIQNQGDRVKIRTKPTITIRDYKADGLLGLDRPTGGSVELYIGIGKYFSLILDDVMEVQSDLNLLSMWSDDAAQQLKIMVDRDVLGGIVGGAAVSNKGATAGVISGNLNLGIKGTPVTVVGRHAIRPPVAGQVESDRRSAASWPGARRAEHPGGRTLGGDVVRAWTHDQAVRTAAGLPVR